MNAQVQYHEKITNQLYAFKETIINLQLGRLPEWFEYFAAVIRTHEGTVPPFLGPYVNYVRRVPLGVCGLLTPWNHPMLIAIKKIKIELESEGVPSTALREICILRELKHPKVVE